MNQILLIGTGPMAIDYVNILQDMNKSFIVIGRGFASAKTFESKTGIKPFVGGLEKYLENNEVTTDTVGIIATGVEMLIPILLVLKETSISRVLVEKPAALSINQLVNNENILTDFAKNIFVAFNRRFYASVFKVQKLIAEDGGLKSMHFEFTEWAHKIEPLEKAEGVKQNWFFANSTHVIDLAFFIGGLPQNWSAYSKEGSLTWHKKTNFAGAGITVDGTLFSYISNWESAGRWSIELLTNKRRIYLKPLEEIAIQNKGTISIDSYEFDKVIDEKFKPGLFNQVEAFLANDKARLLILTDHITNTKLVYNKILNGFEI